MQRGIWQDWLNLVLGAFLVIAPFLYFDPTLSVARGNSWVSGVLVLIFAWVALARPHRWEEVINLILGVWLIISPFVLGYYHMSTAAAWTHVIVGIIVGLDAIFAMRSPVHYHAAT